MDLVKLLAQKLFLPLSYRREGFDIGTPLGRLERTQFASADELRDLQWRRLTALLRHAYEQVPFYRKRLEDASIHPDDIKSDSDFSQIPVLTKSDIREHGEQMLARGVDRSSLIPKKTGGSTGVPLKLFWSRETTAAKKAATIRHDAWSGYRPGEKLASLWGAEDGEETWRYRLYNFLTLRRFALDTLQMDAASTYAFLARIKRSGTRFLFGHAHSLYTLAQFVAENQIDGLPIASVLSTAEVLTASEREVIEDTFRAPVFDRYGCEELSVIASECEAHEGLHLHAEGLWVEIDSQNPEEPGDLIITDLTNEAMPLIRYRTEDMATPLEGNCPCGRTLPRLAKVYGRHTDFLYTPDGRSLSGISIMVNLAIEIPGIWQVQVVQDRLDHLVFRIVRTEQFGDRSLEHLDRLVPQFFGAEMMYDVEYVETLARTPRGKYQFSICQIKKPAGVR